MSAFPPNQLATKRAIELVGGDVCADYADKGAARTVIVVDSGVQIEWEDGTYTILPEDQPVTVLDPDPDLD